MTARRIETKHGTIIFPTFMPVTTFGGKYPLDDLVRPYFKRFTNCLMASYHYAKQMKPTERPSLPLFIDSGGFASLFDGSQCIDEGPYGSIQTKDGDLITPMEVLDFQEKHADIGATLDFIIPPGLSEEESHRRQDMTAKTALWSLHHRTAPTFHMFASVQAWDASSATRIMSQLANYSFDGFALGGMVPRAQTPDVIIEIVRAIRQMDSTRPLHVFGIGHPKLLSQLFNEGVDSTDSSGFLRGTVNKRYLDPSDNEWKTITTVEGKCTCPVCQTHSAEYLAETGEANNLSLALHNLAMTSRTVIL